MLVRLKFLALAMTGALFVCSTVAQGQVFTDSEFVAAGYTSSGIGNQDVRFNANYSNIDVFGDGFLTINIPEAPNSSGGAATRGVFISANNDSLVSGVESFSSVSPLLSNLNVGKGTATANYVMQVDVWNSAGQGVDDGSGNVDVTGTTNYTFVGVNQTNTTVRIQENNSGSSTGQGVGLAITGDRGAAEDYLPHYGGVGYRFRSGIGPNTSGDGSNYRSGQADNTDLSTGLAGDAINAAWIPEGFDFGTGVPETELNQFSGDAGYFAPDPTDTAGFLSDGSGVDRSYFAEAFPDHDDPIAYTADLESPSFVVGNSGNGDGVTYNRWATHRVYYIDDVVTYTIEDSVLGEEVVILEKLINDPTDAGDDTVFDDTSDAGSVVLGFWDRFGGSIALSPEGANFAIYDNLIVSAVNSGDAPSLASAIADYIPGATGTPGDADGDGDVDGADFLLLQQTNPAGITDWVAAYPGSSAGELTTSAVPEPGTAVLLIGLSIGMLCQRKR